MNIFAIELFSKISDESRSLIEKSVITKTSKKGEILFLQDEDAVFFYIVNNGWVKLFRETLDGEEAIVDIVTNSHAFGVDAVFDNLKYSYSSEVVEDTILSQIPIKILNQCLNFDQKLAFNIMKMLSVKQKKHNKEIEHLTIQSAPQRIGCFLLRLCGNKKNQNVVLHLPYDKSLIASRLGMKAETFSRALSKLREEMGMDIKGSSVLIPSVSRLVEYTCSSCSDVFPCEDVLNH